MLAACSSTLNEPLPSITTEVPGGHAVEPPFGFVGFCVRHPSQCADDKSAPRIHLDKATWKLLERVNDAVNLTTVQRPDFEVHGVNEYWGIVRTGYGDCDDMSVTKREMLYRAGLPLYDLRLALVVTFRGQAHLVLTVATDRGDFVLDSLTREILPWNETDYTWITRQGGTGYQWVAVQNASRPRVAGAR